MIEILQFGLSTNRGGIETYLKKIWDHIDHKRFHFSFIEMTGEGGRPCFYEELAESGCTFYKITPRNVSALQNRKDIDALFSENRFDIFHFNVNTLSYLYPVQAALRNGCKVLVHSRNSKASGKITRVMHMLNKARLQHMPVTRIAVSQMAGDWMFGSSGFDVYNNGVITEDFAFTEESRQWIRNELASADKIVIGHVGSFLPVKNHRFMVEAFEVFQEIEKNSVLWFVGDGPCRPEIEEYVREKDLQNAILFLGNRGDMQKIYAGMDMLWLPSLFEGSPNVILEAECEGLPCLLSDRIPPEVILMDNVFSYSLNEALGNWALKMQETIRAQKANRSVCFREMEEKGVSVAAEIVRIESLYETMLSNTRQLLTGVRGLMSF